MNKIALLLTATLATGVAVGCYAGCVGGLAALAEPVLTDQAFNQKITNYQCFRRSFDSTKQALVDGDMPLKEAIPLVIRAARQFWPVYLSSLEGLEPGDSDEERVACNLVGHVNVTVKAYRLPLTPRLAALDAELGELLHDIRTGSSVGCRNDCRNGIRVLLP